MLFSMQLIPSMAKPETNKVSRLLVQAREEETIPWEWIVDETREAEVIASWNGPAEFVSTVRHSYRRDRWAHQPRRVELWSEKSTVAGTLPPVLAEFGITFRVFHGFSSATAIRNIADATQHGPPLIAVYVGDFDPSGMCMSEMDLPARLQRYGANVDLRRIALVESDLANVATFPLIEKRGDSRWRTFGDRYGETCAELDALSPTILRGRVRAAIRAEIDFKAWNRIGRTEAAELASLEACLTTWAASKSRPAPKYSKRRT